MDRLVRARVLLAEAEALGVKIDDLVAASSSSSAAFGDHASSRWGSGSSWPDPIHPWGGSLIAERDFP